MDRTASATRSALRVDGHDLFLFAGDFPYYRLPRRQWSETLARLRAAHLNAAVVTAPWCWHEPEEGEFDLEGTSDPQRDLATALALCAGHGLHILFRPGPYVGGTWRYGGIPGWLLQSCPEILALDAQGRAPDLARHCPPISYLHPVYQAYAAGWYQAFLPLLRQVQAGEQSVLLAVQLDDRPSYWRGLQDGDPLRVDYNPWVIGQEGKPGLYQRWLAMQYGEIRRLNRRYRTRYESFAQVQPPRHPPASYHELPWFSDWRRCKMDLINQHLEYLYGWLREGGLDMPVAVAYPYQSPLAARRCADYFRLRGKPLLVAHASDGAAAALHRGSRLALGPLVGTAELTRRWAGDSELPPLNLDTPSNVSARLGADALAALAVAQVGHGLNGLCLAPMVGPVDPPGGRRQVRGAPIGARGELRPHYAAIQGLGRFLKAHGERLVRSEPLADLALGWYEPYEDCGQQGDTRALGWRDDYRELLGAGLGLSANGGRSNGQGLLTLLASSGLSLAMLDLERDPLETWLTYRQLWVPGADFLSAAVQQELISYVEAGGHLVMLPRVPYLDENLNPCRRLQVLFPALPRPRRAAPRARARAGAVSLQRPRPSGPLAGLHPLAASVAPGAALPNLLPVGGVDTFDLPPQAEALAWEGSEQAPCAYRTWHGQGSATLLGFIPSQPAVGPDDPAQFVRELAGRAGVHAQAASDPPGLHVVERATPAGDPDPAGYLFVINPCHWPVAACLTYTDPRSGQQATLPRQIKALEVPGWGSLILSLELPIPGSDLTLVYSTSQVQGWSVDGERVSLALYGPPGTMGETAFRRTPTDEAASGEGELVIATYPHHQGVTLLQVRA